QQLEETARSLRHGVIGRALRRGPGLPEAADRAVDQARIELAQALFTGAQALGRAGPEVLDVDIGAPDERIEYLGILRALDVQCDAALVPVIGLEMRAVEPALERAERIARARLLDLDDVRAQVGQQHPRGRTGDEGALFDDGD